MKTTRLNLLLLTLTLAGTGCARKHSQTQPQGNEFGSGDFAIQNGDRLELMDFHGYDMDLADENFSSEPLYPAEWEKRFSAKVKLPAELREPVTQMFLNRLFILDAEVDAGMRGESFAERVLSEMEAIQWDFPAQLAQGADDVWESEVRLGNLKLLPLALRRGAKVDVDSGVLADLPTTSRQTATIFHEIYGRMIEKSGNFVASKDRIEDRRMISLMSRGYVRDTFLPARTQGRSHRNFNLLI